jgi:hypothetical protein
MRIRGEAYFVPGADISGFETGTGFGPSGFAPSTEKQPTWWSPTDSVKIDFQTEVLRDTNETMIFRVQ